MSAGASTRVEEFASPTKFRPVPGAGGGGGAAEAVGDDSELPMAQRWPVTTASASANITKKILGPSSLGSKPIDVEHLADSSDRSLSPPPPDRYSSPMAISGLVQNGAAGMNGKTASPLATGSDSKPNQLQPKKKPPASEAPGAAAGKIPGPSSKAKGKARAKPDASLADEGEDAAARAEQIAAQLASTQSSRLILPAWISHMVSATGGGGTNVITIPSSVDENGKEIEGEEGRRKRGTIFSVHVHPDGSRIATAGLDMKIKIWNTAPILDPEWEEKYEPKPPPPKEKVDQEGQPAEAGAVGTPNGETKEAATMPLANGTINGSIAEKVEAEEVHTDPMEERKKHKLLATLNRHTGSVLVVRWSNSGRYLASGSDDSVTLIWEWDRSLPLPSTFPSTNGTTTSSTGGAFSASSLDGPTIENWRPLKRLAGHTADVVDLAWSPADMYLATVSPDSMVIVYSGRTFERLRRIEGHAGFIKGVCFDPVGQFMATASDDKTMKIWRTADWKCETSITKPFEGAPSSLFFARPSWSPDGAHILASNAMDAKVFVSKVVERNSWKTDIALVGHENSIAVAAFSPRLFDVGPAARNAQFSSLMALGSLDQSVSIWLTGLSKPILVARDVFERQVMDLSWSSDGLTLYACSADGNVAAFQLSADEIAKPAKDVELQKAKNNWGFRPTPQQQAMLAEVANQGQSASSLGTASKPNVLQARKGKGPQQGERLSQLITLNDEGKRRIKPTQVDVSSSYGDDRAGLIDPTAIAIDSGSIAGGPSDYQRNPGKRRASATAEDLETLARQNKRSKDTGKNLGSDITRRASIAQKTIWTGDEDVDESGANGSGGGTVSLKWLPTPQALRTYRREQQGWVIECRNSEDKAEPCDIALVRDSKVVWIDWSPSVVLSATCNAEFSAVSLADSTVIVYSKRGKRIALFRLPTPCIQLESTESVLMLLTADGMLRRWDYAAGKELHRPVSLRGVIKNAADVEEIWLHRNGVPILVSRTREEVLLLDAARLEWTCVASGYFADCSALWDSRMRGRDLAASRESYAQTSEPVRLVETLINQLVVQRPIEQGLTRHSPPKENTGTFKLACALRHLEARVQAAELLESPVEYKAHLLMYAKKLSDEGVRNLAEDLVKNLIGPIYFIPNAEQTWSPHILGLNKRELLKEVLVVLGKGKHLSGMVSTYQDILRALLNS